MMGRSRSPALALIVLLAAPSLARAQQTVPQGGGGGGAPQGGGGAPPAAPPAGGGGPAPAPASTGTVTTTPVYPGFVAPPPPGGVLGGGNVDSSSSRPKTGNETDTFDLAPKTGGNTVYGGEGGAIFQRGDSVQLGGDEPPPNTGLHVVRRGDTLWGICDYYFRNPYQWPRIWSYNPQIQNPHWIYPGDQVRLRRDGNAIAQPTAPAPGPRSGSMVDARRQVPPDTVFLRDQGFVADGDDNNANWGELSAAREDKMFLSNFDEVYLRVGPDHDVRIGQELTVFRPIRKVEGGQLIQIQGTVKVDQWNPKERVARAQVTESLDVIERGARIGPVGRRYEVVPPVRNAQDVRAKVLASVHSHPFYAQNAIVFIDKGEAAGLHPGNRLFIVRRGDGYHQSLPSRSAAQRIALESDSPAEIERIPRRDDAQFPEEVVGELRVLAVKKTTATCLVTRSTSEIEQGDVAVARKGY
jgi:LysM domain